MNHYYTYIPGYPVFPYVYNTPYYNSYNYTTSSYPYFENRKFYEERQNIVPIIVWHNSDTNMTLIWFMDGHRIKRRETVLDENERPIFAGLPWNIVGTSNWVNFDQPIITWHNSDTNMTLYWIMNNHKIRRRETVLDENGRPIFVGPPWNIVGTGHMQVIGLGPDIIWHNSDTNMILIWFMNQHKIRSRETVLDENGRPIFVGSPWNIVAVTFKIVPIFNPGPRNNKWKHDQIHEINEK
ncbi:TPA: hypothetical protein QC057_004229 [Bacillus cereus]|nr:hypothetical protein [Bacillus cereus]